MKLLNENKYNEEHATLIAPFVADISKDSYFESVDGKKLHLLSFTQSSAKANVIIMHGFCEWAEKFAETAYYFYGEGYNVFVPDLRGHGYSFKNSAPKYGVSEKTFDVYADDFRTLIDTIKNENSLPIFCFSHSLGGSAALLGLMKYPALPVEKLILSSPMICGNMGMPVFAAQLVAGLMVAVGKGNTPAPGKCEFHPEKSNLDAKSSVRGDFIMKQKVGCENYQTCGPDFNWVKASLEAKDKLIDRDNISKINTDILVIKPEKDAELLESYQDKFIAVCNELNKNIDVRKINNTCHEIFQSGNNALEEYYKLIFDFIK